ncbi:MAG: ATP-binding protein [Calditrichaceae bacterium]
MNISKYSVRTKYILYILTITILVNLIALIIYPRFIYFRSLNNIKNDFEEQIDFIAEAVIDEKANDQVFSEQLVSYLEQYPGIRYAGVKFENHTVFYPADSMKMNEIEELDPGRIHNINGVPVFVLLTEYSRKGPDKSKVTIFTGLKPDRAFVAKNNAFFANIVFFLITLVASVLLIYFIDRILANPTRRLLNITKLFAAGQVTVDKVIGESREFREISRNMSDIALQIAELRQFKDDMPNLLDLAHKKERLIQDALDREIEIMSGLVHLSIELKKTKSKYSIFSRINEDITDRFGYHMSFFFIRESNSLRYYSSQIKGLTLINDKLAKEFVDYLIPENTKEFIEINQANKYISSTPHFQSILDKFNLKGTFAFIPVSTSTQRHGAIVVGYLGDNKRISDQDLEKMVLLANTIAFSAENFDVLATLEKKVRLRTTELETTNKLLAESIREKDNMLKLVSHDLNAPLRNVTGLVDSIHRKYAGQLEPDILDRLERIRRNMEKEMQMIRDILISFKTLEQHSPAAEIDMNMLVESIKDDLQFEFDKKHVVIHINQKLPVIFSNYHLVKHIFLNLIDNACKYFPDDHENNQIDISFTQNSEEYIFAISDNGVGIPLNKQQDIFQSYKKLPNFYPSASFGTGLGLTLVKNMVEKLAGRMWLESSPGAGSTFFICLRKLNFNRI